MCARARGVTRKPVSGRQLADTLVSPRQAEPACARAALGASAARRYILGERRRRRRAHGCQRPLNDKACDGGHLRGERCAEMNRIELNLLFA